MLSYIINKNMGKKGVNSMSDFREINPKEITENAMKLIGSDWMLVAAGDKTKANAMTASWGGVGIMWGYDVAYIVIRPQRYTKEFIDAKTTFSLSFFESSFKEKLGYFGRVSGRDEDKIAKSGMELSFDEEAPYFEDAKLVLVCEKLFAKDFDKESFIDKSLIEKWYPNEDYHTLYIAKINKALIK